MKEDWNSTGNLFIEGDNQEVLKLLQKSYHQALTQEGLTIWLLFDRLDVAFADSPDLEKNAFRALFRAYNDF